MPARVIIGLIALLLGDGAAADETGEVAPEQVPGAVHLDLYDTFNLANPESRVARDQLFVLYCSGVKCRRSSSAAEWAVEWGFTGVHHFRGGIVDWRDAGLPMVEADSPQRASIRAR